MRPSIAQQSPSDLAGPEREQGGAHGAGALAEGGGLDADRGAVGGSPGAGGSMRAAGRWSGASTRAGYQRRVGSSRRSPASKSPPATTAISGSRRSARLAMPGAGHQPRSSITASAPSSPSDAA